jgi:long-subunit acyl-CoA synthetase (AMP-forming)
MVDPITQTLRFSASDCTTAISPCEYIDTEDVVAITGESKLSIIDKQGHFLKLMNGLTISPKRLESYYLKSNLISQIFVTCLPNAEFPVAIVVPNTEALDALTDNEKERYKEAPTKPHMDRNFQYYSSTECSIASRKNDTPPGV